jgi:uncharacterized coiled-coil DUF342 family protein
MKNLLLLLSLCFHLPLTAQIKTARAQFDKQTFEAMQMTIDADYERVADEWEDFWKDRYDVDFDKLDKGRNSITKLAEQAAVPLISTKNANLFVKVEGSDLSATVSFAVTFTANDVVTMIAHPAAFEAARAIMVEFRTHFYTTYFDEKLEEARDDLSDVRDDGLDDNEDAAKARKKIDKYEQKINDYEQKIEGLRKEVGDDLESAKDKARRAKELKNKVRELERMRAKYLN